MQTSLYKTLGVIDTAEPTVIKAAYKALIQIYHPDRSNEEDRIHNTEKTKAINEAYKILSDPELRAAYDNQISNQKNQYQPESYNNSSYYHQQNELLEKNWDLAKQFVADIDNLYKKLTTLSPELGFTFKLVMLESKNFNSADKIANQLEKEFLERYFGKNKKIQKFVVWLLNKNKRDLALEINTIVNVLGDQFNHEELISKTVSKNQLTYNIKEPSFFDWFKLFTILLLLLMTISFFLLLTEHLLQ